MPYNYWKKHVFAHPTVVFINIDSISQKSLFVNVKLIGLDIHIYYKKGNIHKSNLNKSDSRKKRTMKNHWLCSLFLRKRIFLRIVDIFLKTMPTFWAVIITLILIVPGSNNENQIDRKILSYKIYHQIGKEFKYSQKTF